MHTKMFEDNRELKDFINFASDQCLTNTMLYKNILCLFIIHLFFLFVFYIASFSVFRQCSFVFILSEEELFSLKLLYYFFLLIDLWLHISVAAPSGGGLETLIF